ncbi:MAG: RsmB/NOP family class I SAM-dependent RNA methyltransferase [Patescibacteria group bacterium]|jgi:16S rRNA C967 or C1407 C5-methylase (RsmB/RsmF family)
MSKAQFIEYYGKQIELLNFSPKPIILPHPKYLTELTNLWEKAGLSIKPLDWYKSAWLWPDGIDIGIPLPGYELNWFYIMNASSLKPVLALNVQSSEIILDACAAPGGKATLLAHQLNNTGKLYCYDNSNKRINRLRDTFQNSGYNNIHIKLGKSEILFKKYPDFFVGILLDAPCSSEKHVWHSEKYLAAWTPSRIKRLKQQQIALINGLWLALKPGGRLVYATCALNEAENEGVILDFQKRHPEAQLLLQERIKPDEILFDPMSYALLTKPKK